MNTLPSVIGVALLCAEAMERAQVPYFLGGSLASSLQGEPRSSLTKVDLFMLRPGPFDASEFSRRTRTTLSPEGRGLYIKSPEDTVLRKLMWFRDGGEVSTSQWRDIVQVLRVSAGKLDDSYLDEWSGRLGVASLLAKAREAAG